MSELEQAGGAAPSRELTFERLESPTEVLSQGLSKLAKVGGFDFVESTIEGTKNLNPERKALKKIFLTEADKKKDREELKKKLLLWYSLLTNNSSVSDMVEECNQKADTASKTVKKNLKKTLEASRALEESYRSLALFYKNTESDKLKNVTILNAEMEQLQDLDNPRFIDYVSEELKKNYDRLDLKDNYSLMVVPGYLGSNKVIDKWAKIAYDNKVMMCTDFRNLDSVDEVVDLFEAANHTSADAYKSNIIMSCNYLVGRGKNEEVGEEEDVFVGGSAALAGKMYTTLMSQVTAGKKHGALNEVDGVKFNLKKSDISNLDKIGLVPMVNEYGKVMAFSAKTLFNGDNLGLQTYSVVRVFDYITKVLIDFLNRRAFENWTSLTEKDLRSQIVKFLDTIQGPSKLIESFKIMKFERDENIKDKINLDIHIVPYFPAKSFIVRLDGQKGEDAETTWASEYAQQ